MSANMIDRIKKVRFKKLIYPLTLMTFFCVVGLLLFYSIRFFTTELNTVFSLDSGLADNQGSSGFDSAGYEIIRNKFKLASLEATTTPIAPTTESVASSSSASSTPIDEAASATGTTTASSSLGIVESTASATATIAVLNSTKTPGLASKIKNSLTAAGLPVIKIGNSYPVLATTTINLSPAMAGNASLATIKTILAADGFEAIENLLPVAGRYDIEIILGND